MPQPSTLTRKRAVKHDWWGPRLVGEMIVQVANSVNEESREGHIAPRIDQLLSASAVSRADQPAVVTPIGRLTYAELLDRSTRAQAVLPAGHQPVAVIEDLTTESLVLTFAVLLSGRALIPIDPRLPAERVHTIVEMCGAVVAPPESLIGETVVTGSHKVVEPDAVAIVNVTSGSTGAPKVVIHTHRTALTKASDVVIGLGLRSDDRMANLLPLGFSAGITTLLAGVSCGATVLCADTRELTIEAVVHWLQCERATTVHASVALARALGAATRDGAVTPLTSARQVCLYGEPATGRDVAAARCISDPTPRVVNWYATTEVGVVAYAVIGPGDPLPVGRVPAGRCLDKYSLSILDESGSAVRDGEVGEIHLEDGPRSAGYLHELTDPWTTLHPLNPAAYRTGDRGFVDGEGRLTVTGRSDNAVKIRGYLVDPSEIEKSLHGADGVEEVHISAIEHGDRPHLVAYVGGSIVDLPDAHRDLRSRMRTTLPEWMIPHYVVVMENLPRTERGKIDPAALPDPVGAALTRAPRGHVDLVEGAVRMAVSAAMGPADIGVDDDLVAIGADSLALTEITTLIRRSLNIDVDLATFTARPTIATLVEGIRNHTPAQNTRCSGVAVPLRNGEDTPTLVTVAGAGAPAAAFIPLVRRLTSDVSVLGFQQRGLERRGRPDRTVVRMARRYLKALTQIHPHGPYVLAGHSMGGLVALELAAQLEARGDRVLRVLAIDTVLRGEHVQALGRDLPALLEEPDDTGTVVAPGPQLRPTRRQLVILLCKSLVAGRVIFDPVTQWAIFFHRGSKAAQRYSIRKITAPVTVLCAPGSRHSAQWWNATTDAGAELHTVRGGHVDLLHEPYVDEIATHIDRCTAADLVEVAHPRRR